MTPKEKAAELIDKYLFVEIANYTSMFEIKQCALIAADEILKEYSVLQIETSFCYEQYLYWEKVKQEIEKL